MLCACCSGKKYIDCCADFLAGKKIPATPEELMRSRYSAYAALKIDYIAATMRAPANIGFNSKTTKNWASRIQWLKLEVISASQQGTIGHVEFKAYFTDKKKHLIMHELSEFHFLDGKWFYVSGEHLA
jgi:SEC-C motif domain protein